MPEWLIRERRWKRENDERKIWEETITNIDDLKLAILREWEAFPQDTINRAIDSFRRRIQMVVDAEREGI